MADENIEKLMRDAVDDALKSRGRVNVLIAGRSGVGKSTLINGLFQGDFAATGAGRPVTPGTREITKEGVPISLFDTRGLELDQYATTFAALKGLLAERRKDPDPNRHIHVAMVCIPEDLRRVEAAESNLVEMLAEYCPVLVVITKARADQGFKAQVQSLLPQASNVVRVRALREVLDDGPVLNPFGLDDLIHAMLELVPEAHRRALVAAQKVDLDLKRSHARAAIATAAATAAAAGAAPIPFSDAAVIAPIQALMLARISAVYGLSVTHTFVGTLAAAAIGGTLATLGGRALVTGLLKLIPGANVVGMAIAAATASALTMALGEAYNTTLYNLYTSSDGEQPAAEAVLTGFKAEITRRRSTGS